MSSIELIDISLEISELKNISLNNKGEYPISAIYYTGKKDDDNETTKKFIGMYGGVNLGLNMRNGSVGGGSGGNSGSSGGNGGNGGNGRYVERMGADGKVWGTCTTNTGAQAWTAYKATDLTNSTHQYNRPGQGNTEHTTLHRNGAYHVHGWDGSKRVY